MFSQSTHFLSLCRQTKFDSVNKQMESMEMEVMEARLIRASELNGEMDDDDTGLNHKCPKSTFSTLSKCVANIDA